MCTYYLKCLFFIQVFLILNCSLDYGNMSSCKWILALQRNILVPSSGLAIYCYNMCSVLSEAMKEKFLSTGSLWCSWHHSFCLCCYRCCCDGGFPHSLQSEQQDRRVCQVCVWSYSEPVWAI
jgi:hypothetical protein